MRTLAPIIIWTALPVGTAAALAAFYGRYRTLPAFLTGPTICRLEDNGCKALFRTPLAAVLGVPNSLLGLVFYALLGTGLAAGWPARLLLLPATFAVGLSVYLGFRLIHDRLECRICWTGHAANALLWLGLLFHEIESLRGV
ncbi:MAG: vitamin K epoxide reductase family protein [Thermoanaerobaculia bacterium]